MVAPFSAPRGWQGANEPGRDAAGSEPSTTIAWSRGPREGRGGGGEVEGGRGSGGKGSDRLSAGWGGTCGGE